LAKHIGSKRTTMGKAYGTKGGTFGEYVEEDVGNPLLS